MLRFFESNYKIIINAKRGSRASPSLRRAGRWCCVAVPSLCASLGPLKQMRHHNAHGILKTEFVALMVSENVAHDHITASFPVRPGTETGGLSKWTLGHGGRDATLERWFLNAHCSGGWPGLSSLPSKIRDKRDLFLSLGLCCLELKFKL